ncbi:TPA: ABC transporter permease [Streptococcus suis]|uniref:Binding-protein-dependent transport system membrane protein n=4 Tax=Streptococcus suis TaxID=1307 RepID=A0A0H3MU47_STRS4|nr:ABC transporter permease subunit [Streptococcus suis]ADV70370.1 binding-protein-dependent transport system membrane protein [Streptococcus suis JS14]AER15415.1 binding-protein-dependent transport system membrane protein [Streptococcus suis SS12]AER21010.1 binding-protein-dependent transport system membrane protein [Streptococcus suis ST1]AER44504.1 binding-protein-dependent transport system membrane protein [Streptococcus suis A7]AFR00635.1 binding-protein-dependent transport system membran
MKTSKLQQASLFDRIKQQKLLLLMLLPGLVLTFIFRYIPMYGVLIAFKDYNPLKGVLGSEWIGFEEFTKFLSSPNFGTLLANTLKLSVYGLLLGFLLPIILAIMLNQLLSDKAKKRIQLVLYAPNFISVVVIVGMIFLFFSVGGPVNSILGMFGIEANFLTDPDFFRPLYILSGIWQGMGWASTLYTATLINVDPALIEAAKLDGANIFQRIWHIDLPALKPVMVIQFILAAGGIMNVGYEKAFLMQTSLNLTSSEIISTYVYKIGLVSGDYSYSTAVGLFNALINIILLIAVNKIVKRINDGQGL